MKEKIEISENERKVLQVLFDVTDTWGENCISFSYIEGDTNLKVKDIRAACQVLRKKGLAIFYRGLMTEDGEVAGSGYCISPEGKAFIFPCDLCEEEATFEYDGKRECQEHYKQSTKTL